MDTSPSMNFEGSDVFCGNSSSSGLIEDLVSNSTGTTFMREDKETISTHTNEVAIELSEKILEKQAEFAQRTSTTIFLDTLVPKPIPLIQGLGAIEFRKELDSLKYSDEIREFYKGSKELVKKLNIL